MKENVIQTNGGIVTNVDVSVKNDWNRATCDCENGKYLASIIMIHRLFVMKL